MPARKVKKRQGTRRTKVANATTWALEPGHCFCCNCTDEEACEGGCAWVDAERTLCSTCADELGRMFMAFIRSRGR